MIPLPRVTPTLLDRIVANVVVDGEAGCWVWQACTVGGYGKINVGTTAYRAHRIMCQHANGDAPEGKPLALHKCNNRLCVRGDHLYWGDTKDNGRDAFVAESIVSIYRDATHCTHGHEFTPENTYWYRGRTGLPHRKCLECNRRRARDWARSKRAAA